MKRDPAGLARQRRAVELRARHYTELAAYATGLGCTPAEARQVADDSLAQLTIYESGPATEPIGNDRAWLYRTAQYKAWELFRDRFRRHVPLDDVSEARLIDPHVGPARHAELTEILDAIRMLPQRLRDPLLFRMAGFSHKEIAGFLACSADTARQRICRARRVLSTWLGVEPATSLSATTRRRAE